MSGRRGWFDVQSPVLRPLWLRIAIVVFVFGWTVIEAVGGHLVWAAIFGAAGLYLAWQFFVVWNPDGRDEG